MEEKIKEILQEKGELFGLEEEEILQIREALLTKGINAKQLIESFKNESLIDKINKVNEELKSNEPTNVSVDTFTKYTGYKPQYVVDAMNKHLGVGQWGFCEVQNQLKEGEKTTVITKVEAWVGNTDNKFTAWGGAMVTRGSVSDAMKSAQTDALKKALSYFSVGYRAYRGLLKK